MTQTNTWKGGMTLDQVESLKPVFAKLTENGWVLPNWFLEMEQSVLEYSYLTWN